MFCFGKLGRVRGSFETMFAVERPAGVATALIFRVDQGLQAKGKSGPRSYFIRCQQRKINKSTKNLLNVQNLIYPETITLRKMSGPRTVV